MFPERRDTADGGKKWTSRSDASGDRGIPLQGTGVWMIDHAYKTDAKTTAQAHCFDADTESVNSVMTFSMAAAPAVPCSSRTIAKTT